MQQPRRRQCPAVAKGTSSWSQFVAMPFCQLGRAHSLREIEGGLKVLNYMVRVLIIGHTDHARLAAAIGRTTVDVENAMLATMTPDDLIDQVKEQPVHFRELAQRKHERPCTDKPEGLGK